MADQLFAFTFDATADFRAPLYGQLDRIGTAISSYHKLEEASGNRVDVIPSGITLTDTNTVGQATGVVGDCADFTRANSEELVGSSSDHDFDGAADFAILIWASVDDNTGAGSNVQGPAVSKWTNSDRGWMLVYDQFADEWQFALSSDGTAVTAVGGGTFISTAFALVYADYDSGTGQSRCSTDDGTKGTASPGTTINQNAQPFRVGSTRFEGVASLNDYFEGQIDEVLIFNRKLTDAELTAIHAGGNGRDLEPFVVKDFSFSFDATADFTLSFDDTNFAVAFDATADLQADLSIGNLEFDFDATADFTMALDVQISTVDFVVDFDATADFDASLGAERSLVVAFDALAEFQQDLFTTDVQGLVDDLLGLTGQIGPTGDRLQVPGVGANIASPAIWTDEALLDLMDTFDYETGEVVAGTPAAATPTTHNACELAVSLSTDWFGKLYVIPLSVEAGLVITTQTHNFEVYSSFLTGSHSLDTLVNNVGGGITFSGLPVLPETLGPQDGFTFDVLISPEGPATISGTLDFGFDLYTTPVPFTGVRLRLLGVEPVAPLEERLGWATDVLRASKEFEQRVSARNTPRQQFQLTYELDGLDRQIFENLLFDHHGRAFSMPVWIEPIELSANAAATDTDVQVVSTAYADLRAGSLVVVWEDSRTFEIMTVDSFTSTQINFTTQLEAAHNVESTWVYPVRVGNISALVSGRKAPEVIQTYTVTFDALDNDVDLADTSVFPTFNGKVLLDEPNWIAGRQGAGSLERQLDRVDGTVGPFAVFADADVDRDRGEKRWLSTTRQRLWEVRRLLHALKGRLTSFYIPTFAKDLTPVSSLAVGSDKLTIDRFGYSDFVMDRAPRNVIWVRFTDGTTLVRTVTGSVNLTSTTEELTLDGFWPATRTVDEVDRISFLLKARLDSDTVRIRHKDARGNANIDAPFISVLE